MAVDLVEWRVRVGGVLNPAATPSFLVFATRAAVSLDPSLRPSIVNRGLGKFIFVPSAAHLAEGYAYLIDNGAGSDDRYIFGAVYGGAALPLAAFGYFDGAGGLWAGGGTPVVEPADYVTAAGVARTPNAPVAQSGSAFWSLSATQGDIDAGGVTYVVTSPPGASPDSYDGSFVADYGWTYDPSTDIGKVRLLIGDTNSSDRLLLDSEIQFFLDQSSGELYAAAIAACYAIAGKFARSADFTNLSLSVSASQRAEAYRQLAKDLAAQLASGATGSGGASMFVGGASISGKESLSEDSDAVQPSFSIGQDDEPGANTATPYIPSRWGG